MTREEAINILNRDDDSMRKGYFCINDFEAIEVLKSEESILDKIRDEIDAESAKSFKYPNWERAKALEWALEIIDKYEEDKENG